ncbi:hypothetical protein X777_07067 [Ooceraea biroi]|uniref:Uncharacterized protein n=1 Tax=Ooceraea biroi TaxID=2015173 RepID=A0A026WAK5_OOCBI|nr:hypothetical protein X777_07067 [Ooceraea biroi]
MGLLFFTPWNNVYFLTKHTVFNVCTYALMISDESSILEDYMTSPTFVLIFTDTEIVYSFN